jgi:hypothetical protein
MDKSRIRLWIGFLAFVIAALLYLFWPGEKGLNWYENYRPDSKQPYGTHLLFASLKIQEGKDRFLEVKDSLAPALEKWAGTPANYIYVGDAMWIDSLDEAMLLDFTSKGNTLFLSLKYPPDNLIELALPPGCLKVAEEVVADDLEELYDEEEIFAEEDYLTGDLSGEEGPVSISLHREGWEKTVLKLEYYSRKGPEPYDWSHVPEEMLDCLGAEAALGNLDEEWVNFIRIPYGEGQIILHTTPLAFSNFYLKQEKGWDYAGKALSFLNEGPILWDRYSDYESAARRNWGRRSPRNTRTLQSEGPLEYLLSQPSLAWAWYVSLGLALSYLIFRAKRKQRIIPILESNTNTSLEFIATIGQLYFQQHNHRKLAVQKWRLFLSYIRERYHITTRELDDAFIKKLAERSGVDEPQLQSLFRLARNIERSEVFLSENTLVDLHKALDVFYRHCK